MGRASQVAGATVLLVLSLACRAGPAIDGSPPPSASGALSTPFAQPRFELVGQPAIRPSRPDQAPPTFDEADVRAFVARHPDLSVDLRPGPAVVDQIAFLSQREVKTRFDIGPSLRQSDQALLCVVTVHGRFFRAPDSPEPALQTLHVVFDGRTGNELLLAADAP